MQKIHEVHYAHTDRRVGNTSDDLHLIRMYPVRVQLREHVLIMDYVFKVIVKLIFLILWSHVCANILARSPLVGDILLQPKDVLYLAQSITSTNQSELVSFKVELGLKQ